MGESGMRLIVTGGAGFIGSAICRHVICKTSWRVANIDKLTYAANLTSLADVAGHPRYKFIRADITNRDVIRRIFEETKPDAVLNLAAESHVDRSIDSADNFIETNIRGTFILLEEARRLHDALPTERKQSFRFHHVSTDEVFGSLEPSGDFFTETTAYDPSSPYSASKAASDHLVRAWNRTYGLPVLITNCSNNYGPYQHPEKLVPLMILRALRGQSLPVYGSGENIRDWLYVEDHAEALIAVLEGGVPGNTYNIGGSSERRNIDVVEQICDILDEIAPTLSTGPRRNLIQFVQDRPGHDQRYAIDASKLQSGLGWRPNYNFESGLRLTVQWYLKNRSWWQPLVKNSDALSRLGQVAKTPEPLLS